MTQSPLLTLAAGVVGATIGLAAPFVSGALSRRAASRDNQRAVAAEILELYKDAPLSALLGDDSPSRRKLFVLALMLRDQSASEASKALVLAAAHHDATTESIYPAWQAMVEKVHRVFHSFDGSAG